MSQETDVVALRSFIPAKDFDTSFRFYQDLGFTATRLDAGIGLLQLGPFSCFLQKYHAPGFAESYMMQLLVKDLDAWWARIQSLNLPDRYAVQPPSPPKLQPWGLRVSYVYDPDVVLWHITQDSD